MTGQQPPPPDDARLRALLGGPATAWLRERVRTRIAAGRPLTGAPVLRDPSPAQRAAVQELLGRAPGSGRSISVPLAVVEDLLRDSGAWPAGLRSAVEHLEGPVSVRSTAAAAEAATWAALLAPMDELCGADSRWGSWWTAVRASPALRRTLRGAEGPARLVAGLRAVLSALPSDGEALGTLAQRTLGNPHALDPGPLAGWVLSALAQVLDRPPPASAADRRALWAGVGVAVDDVSSTVLIAGLPGDGTPTGVAVQAFRDRGLPTVLTLRHLVSDRPRWPVGPSVVHACENPVVLAAALDRFGHRTPPLVCLAGRPSAAGVLLVRSLVADGVRVRYHGDLDWGGLSIMRSVLDLGAEPWRMGVGDYRRAVATAGRALRGRSVETPWDPELSAEVQRTGLGVDEEAVLAELIGDLDDAARR